MSIYDEEERKVIMPTYDGVDIEIVKVANSSLFKLINAKGGALSKELEGMFTTPQKAIEHLNNYNKNGFNSIAAKERKAKDEEQKVKDLLVAEPTPDNYVAQRKAQLKQERVSASN